MRFHWAYCTFEIASERCSRSSFFFHRVKQSERKKKETIKRSRLFKFYISPFSCPHTFPSIITIKITKQSYLRRFSTTSLRVDAGAARGSVGRRRYHRRCLLAEQTLHLGPVQVCHRRILMLVRHQGPDVPLADHLRRELTLRILTPFTRLLLHIVAH